MKELLQKIEKAGLVVDIVDGRLKLYSEGAQIDPEILDAIKAQKQEITEYLIRNDVGAIYKVQYDSIPLLPQAESYAISDAQRRLWILSQFGGGSVAYNIPGSIYLNQHIQIDLFRKAIDATIERHEILRTVFKADAGGEVRQWVLNKEDLDYKIAHIDLRNEQNKKDKVQSYIQDDSFKAFDLENGPLLRACLMQVEDEEYVFYYNMHHIISDGWSMEVLSKDIFAFYDAYKTGGRPGLEKLKIQYKDYSAWQLGQLEKDAFHAHRAYWLESLKGELPLLDLPGRKPRPAIKTSKGHGLSTFIDPATTARLQKYAQEHGGSLFMCLLAAWNVLIHRYTSQSDIIIGSPIAGREHADLGEQIGFYVNTLALRNEIKPGENFNAFYARLKDNTIKSYSHQMYPFDRLVEELKLQRDTSRSAVFDIMLVLQNNEETRENGQPAFKLSEDELDALADLGPSVSKFDMEIAVRETSGYLSLQVIYNPDVYEKEMTGRLMKHYKQLLKALLDNPQEKISQLDFLSDAEKRQLLETFNDTAVAYPEDKTIVDLFEEQAMRTPDSIAILFEEKRLTYNALNERSNQLAAYLQKNYNIQPDDLVGVKLERSEWLIIAVLGILKAGGAYVPIDPEYPKERIDYIESDTRCKVSIDENELNKFRESQKEYAKRSVRSAAGPDSLAYVIYTSGSTGRPKGVMIERRNAYSFIKWTHDEFASSEFDTVLFTTSLNFDLSVFEIFHTLTKGKELRILKDGLSIPNYLKTPKKLLINTVPSVVGALLQQAVSFDAVSVLNMAGEPIPANYRLELKGKVKEIRNLYGPSEDTTYSTFIRIDQDERELIGRPISNTQIYILSEEQQLQPVGVPGEICISGAGLARGYLNQEELTGRQFIEDPFKPGGRIYRTGDLGRWLADGNIEFLGRKDQQVKIRGYRIELGEIEHALQSHNDIEDAVVLARENDKGEKELVAYLTAGTEQNTASLRTYLKDLLPVYMLPAHYVQLDAMPRTSNGKIDKKALPNPAGFGMASGTSYAAPRNEVEKKVVEIWEMVLDKKNIGINDDFFELGGYSMKAMGLIAEYNKSFGVRLALQDIWERTRLASHAELIEIQSWIVAAPDQEVAEKENIETLDF